MPTFIATPLEGTTAPRLAAPEGLARPAAAHPNVAVIAVAADRGLDARGYIGPGLGDAGDRLFGTG